MRCHAGESVMAVAVLAVVVVRTTAAAAAAGGDSRADPLPPEAVELSWNPPTNATCKEEPGFLPCEIHQLPKDNCFVNFQCLYTTLNPKYFSYKFDDQRDVTELNILNRKERVMYLTTVSDNSNEMAWQLTIINSKDINYNITIINLPGRLAASTTIQLPDRFHDGCKGCPAPRVHWMPSPKLHTSEIFVSLQNVSSATGQEEVEIQIFSSNDTNFDVGKCFVEKNDFHIITRGRVNKLMTAYGMFSTAYCFRIVVYFSDLERVYLIGFHQDMTEPLNKVLSRVHVPNWWLAVIIAAISVLVLMSIAPLAIHRGMIRLQCRKLAQSNTCWRASCSCQNARRNFSEETSCPTNDAVSNSGIPLLITHAERTANTISQHP